MTIQEIIDAERDKLAMRVEVATLRSELEGVKTEVERLRGELRPPYCRHGYNPALCGVCARECQHREQLSDGMAGSPIQCARCGDVVGHEPPLSEDQA